VPVGRTRTLAPGYGAVWAENKNEGPGEPGPSLPMTILLLGVHPSQQAREGDRLSDVLQPAQPHHGPLDA
jgi:hypothetical protein